MGEFFDIIGKFFEFIINHLTNIGEFISVAFESLLYLMAAVTYLPFYMQSFLLLFICVGIVLLILNRG